MPGWWEGCPVGRRDARLAGGMPGRQEGCLVGRRDAQPAGGMLSQRQGQPATAAGRGWFERTNLAELLRRQSPSGGVFWGG